MLTNSGRKALLDGSLLLLTHTIKAVLLNPAYTPDMDHDFASDVNGFELSGVGYASGFGGTGRKAIASKVVGKDDSLDIAYFDFADVTWTAINAGTVKYMALIREVTSDADSPLLGVFELPLEQTTTGADWTWQVPSPGMFIW